eukprot:12646.XXX_718635_719979_1 [CDS] Oithona nana genome sequencing.
MDVSEDHINADGMNIVQQIHQEIRLLRLVEGHQFIIELVEVFESSAFIFLVFELCQNNDLFEYLSANVSLSEKRCRAIMKQIFEAVYHCHKKKVLHRDIKPENILLDEHNNVKLTDFGLAKEVGDERLYECVGTPGYLAPEVLEAGMCERNECDGYSFEVDAWACGVVMYTLLVGTPPFWHHRQLNMIRLIMRGNYSMEGPTWQTVTSETKDLIKKLLVVNPRDRLTIEQALQHEVFHAQRFTRQDGELLCIVHEDINDNTDNDKEVEVKEEKSQRKFAISTVVPILSSKKKFLSKKKSSVIIKNVKFNARKMFKNAICCVRFLVRLSHVHTTPVLLSLSETRINPYNMRSYRKAIERHSFNLYSHWIKKGQGQDRAAVFQHTPKRDSKRKKSQMMKKSEITKK